MSEKRHKTPNCELPKCNREKQSRLGPPCFCFFSKPLIYGFWRNAHDHAAGYVNIKQGRSQDFSKGRSQTETPSGDCRLYMVYTAALPRVSAGSVIAAWRSILTKDESRWRKYFTKKQILKKWAFQKWLLRPRYCHGWRGGHGHHPRTTRPLATLLDSKTKTTTRTRFSQY